MTTVLDRQEQVARWLAVYLLPRNRPEDWDKLLTPEERATFRADSAALLAEIDAADVRHARPA